MTLAELLLLKRFRIRELAKEGEWQLLAEELEAAGVVVGAGSPAPSPTETHVGCHDCGRRYGDEYGFPDLLVPHEIWNTKLSPKGTEGGLLCPSCMCKRAYDAGLTNVSARFVSGPFAVEAERAPAVPSPAPTDAIAAWIRALPVDAIVQVVRAYEDAEEEGNARVAPHEVVMAQGAQAFRDALLSLVRGVSGGAPATQEGKS